MPSKSESVIQKEILKFAKMHKKVAWIDRANSGKVKVRGGFMQLHENGTPDLLGYAIDGKFIGIEIKDEANFNSKNNGLRAEQITRIDHILKNGGYAGVACNIDHVEAIMCGD